MKFLRTRRAAACVAVLVVVGILFAGCSGDGEKPLAPGQDLVDGTMKISDAELGEALRALVFPGRRPESTGDSGQCLVAAVRKAGLSREAQAYIAEADGEDLGTVVEGLREIEPGDAELLLSPQLREDFDACVDEAAGPKRGKTLAGRESDSGRAEEHEKRKGGDRRSDQGRKRDEGRESSKPSARPDLEPRYDIEPGTKIVSVSQLRPGLVSMFSSYARSDEQRRVYRAAGDCLAGVVLDAGFSQETLRFLAGGAPIGTGSVADYLPDEGDQRTWRSREFTAALASCTLDIASARQA